jgi:ABC-2 type transport system permease protein
MMFFSWLPVLFSGLGFFLYEQSVANQSTVTPVAEFAVRQYGTPELLEKLRDDPASVRHEVWTTQMLVLFRWSQAVMLVCIVGVVAPRLISYDLRTRGYLLYFSRPVSPAEYLLGKAAVIWSIVAALTALPALVLYVVAVLLSPSLTVVYDTWDLPLRVLLGTATLAVPLSAVAICFSSATTESRFASFAWFAIWIVGFVTYQILRSGDFDPEEVERTRFGMRASEPYAWRWFLISPYHVLGAVQSTVFGIEIPTSVRNWAYGVTSLVTVLATFIAYRRVAATLKV